MPLQIIQLLFPLQWKVVYSMCPLMWTLKFAKINYSTAHKEKYEHWWQESCTVQNVCGINALFLFVFSLYFVVRVHQHSSFTCKILKNVLLGDGLSLDPPPPLLLSELCHLFDLLWVCKYVLCTHLKLVWYQRCIRRLNPYWQRSWGWRRVISCWAMRKTVLK